MEGGTQAAKDKDQLLVLKVMRLTRPSFYPTIPVITDSRDLAGKGVNVLCKQVRAEGMNELSWVSCTKAIWCFHSISSRFSQFENNAWQTDRPTDGWTNHLIQMRRRILKCIYLGKDNLSHREIDGRHPVFSNAHIRCSVDWAEASFIGFISNLFRRHIPSVDEAGHWKWSEWYSHGHWPFTRTSSELWQYIFGRDVLQLHQRPQRLWFVRH